LTIDQIKARNNINVYIGLFGENVNYERNIINDVSPIVI